MLPPTRQPGGSGAAHTLLVVDDEPNNRDLLCRRLEQHGFAVVAAADGSHALAALDSGPCDAVLLDVMMPGQSGLEVLTAIRQDPGRQQLPVIMVTARGDSRDIVEALELGANDYVTKPIDFSVALARVRAQLGRVTAERAALAEQRQCDLRHAQKLSAVGQLTSGVAHDFNNLLAAIQGHSEFLEEELGEADPRRRHVMQIRKATDNAAQLTRQLLSYGRRHPASKEPLDLEALTRSMVRLLLRVIGDQVVVAVEVTPGGVQPVIGDAGQFDQVLLNLVVNACDAMPGGGRLLIRLENVAEPSGAPQRWVRLTVADTGCGMDEETRAHIFEPFFTTKAAGQGTGLGLAMVRTIAEGFGGTVSVSSEPGNGACFHVLLPCREAGEPSVA